MVYVQLWWQKALVKYWGHQGAAYPISREPDHLSLMKIFQDLGPSVFFGVGRQGYPISQFFTWLDYEVRELCLLRRKKYESKFFFPKAPLDFRTRFVVEKFPLYQLDLDRLFRSLCAQQWCIAWRGSGAFFTCDDSDLTAISVC